MNQPTIRERLNQIVEYEIPHIVRGGNGLSEKGNYEVIGILQGRIPEVVISGVLPENIDEWAKNIFENGYEFYANSLSEASGRSIQKTRIGNDKGGLYTSLFDIRAFYNPQSDMTHYFILPNEGVVKSIQSEMKRKE